MIPDDFLDANASGVLKETVYIILGICAVAACGGFIGWVVSQIGWLSACIGWIVA